MEPTPARMARVGRVLFPFLLLATLWPAVPAAVALLSGLTFGLSIGNPWLNQTKQCQRRCCRRPWWGSASG